MGIVVLHLGFFCKVELFKNLLLSFSNHLKRGCEVKCRRGRHTPPGMGGGARLRRSKDAPPPPILKTNPDPNAPPPPP